jgi:hypothetical protein
VSLGNPLLGPMAVLGVTVHGQLIRAPESRVDRNNPDAWLTGVDPGDELHHHLPGYVPEGLS